MYLRSRDGKRIVEARDFEVKGSGLYINGALFEEYESEAAALTALVTIGRELASLETFVDLSGEIEDEDEDDDFFDLYDEDEDEDELVFGSDEDDADILRRMFQRKK